MKEFPWRNWIARQTSNLTVAGSNPGTSKTKRIRFKTSWISLVVRTPHCGCGSPGSNPGSSKWVRFPLTTDTKCWCPRGLMDKALVSEARDCGFKSRRGLPLDYKEKLSHMGLQTDTLAVRVRIPLIPQSLPPRLGYQAWLPLMTTPVHDDIM